MAKAYRTHLTQPAHAMDGHTYVTHTTHAHNSLLQTMLIHTSSPQVTTIHKYILTHTVTRNA